MGEKWVYSSTNQGYFITPDGTLYKWAGGTSVAGSTVVGNIGSRFHTDPTLLQDPTQLGSFSALTASQLNQNLDLHYGGSYSLNWGGWNEKWIEGAGSNWYFITPSGGFYQWSGGVGLANSRMLASFDVSFYASPDRLFNAPAPVASSAAPLVQALSMPGGGFAAEADSALQGVATELGQAGQQRQTLTQQRGPSSARPTNQSQPAQVRQSQLRQSRQSSDSDATRPLPDAAHSQAILDLFSTADDELDALSEASLNKGLVSRRIVRSLFD